MNSLFAITIIQKQVRKVVSKVEIMATILNESDVYAVRFDPETKSCPPTVGSSPMKVEPPQPTASEHEVSIKNNSLVEGVRRKVG